MNAPGSSIIRILDDGPLDGPTNMARDEALLTCVGRSESPPTLRLYQWEPPTISLGYFQRYADYESLLGPAGTMPVVRRLTGGGAILHDLELTYSLTLPSDHRLLAKGANRLYGLAHDAVIGCFASLGLTATRAVSTELRMVNSERRMQPDDHRSAFHHSPFTIQHSDRAAQPFFCFERRHVYDVLIGQDKIAGSAQRRRRDAILQHGSIILGNRFAQQATATVPLPFDEAIQRVRSSFAQHLARTAGDPFQPGHWSTPELTAAEPLIAKYAGTKWTTRT